MAYPAEMLCVQTAQLLLLWLLPVTLTEAL